MSGAAAAAAEAPLRTGLLKRIIPCLDVRDDQVVKGRQFRDHEVVGAIEDLALRYAAEGADELVFYDITASAEDRVLSRDWVRRVGRAIDIPFSVAGGIRSVAQAEAILAAGAEKISVNSPALERPALIEDLAKAFGQQCVVVGIDSRQEEGDWVVYQYTGDVARTVATRRRTLDWAREAADRGAGEIVLNAMNQDGMRQGYDLAQMQALRAAVTIPLVASGGAGSAEHVRAVLAEGQADAALAASLFHKRILSIPDLKRDLAAAGVPVRL